MKCPVLVFVPLVALLPASPAAAADVEGVCQLSWAARTLGEQCRSTENKADFCGWIPAAEALIRGGAEVERSLEQAFGLSPETARKVLAETALYLLMMIDETSCSPRQQTELIERITAFREDRVGICSPDNFMFPVLFRLLDVAPDLLDQMAPAFGQGAAPEVRRSLEGFYTLLHRTGVLPEVRKMVTEIVSQNDPGIFAAVAGTGSNLPPDSVILLADVDRALMLARQGDIGAARKRIEALVAASPPSSRGLALTRAGFGFLRLARSEDALALLTRAEPLLASAPRSDQVSLFLYRVVFYSREAIKKALSMPGDTGPEVTKSRLTPALEKLAAIVAGAAQEMLDTGDGAAAHRNAVKAAASLDPNELDERSLKDFMTALEVMTSKLPVLEGNRAQAAH